ncbi:MAG: hypothetical protein [Microvirus sp.]|nr:MAG: hypothetical protein [Microvirus sp.]
MDIQFNTPYKRIHSHAEVNSGEILVDDAGYIPREVRIKRLLEAGELLESYGSGSYDMQPDDETDIEDIDCDPTRHSSFDMADASIIKKSLIKKRKAAMDEAVANARSAANLDHVTEVTPRAPESAQEAPSK